MRQKGFTLIELMILVVIGLTILMIGARFLMVDPSSISMGVNGLTETRCIEGYKFILGEDGKPRQILNEFGKGVACEKNTIGKM